jgi:MFS transporter, DHA3 family, macrolide efflux protein
VAKETLWAPLTVPDYRKLWVAQSISVVGDKVDQIAMAMLVFERTGSMLQMGIMLGVTTLPAALFSMFAGVFVDRWDRRVTMIISDVLRAALVLLIPLVAGVNVLYAYAVAFLVATVSLFFEPARLSLVPEILDSDRLMAANSLDNASTSTAELLGLGIGGALVALLGWQTAFYIDAATYVCSAAMVFFVRYRPAPRTGSEPLGRGRVLSEILEGIRYIRDTAVLRDLVSVYSIAAMGIAGTITLAHLLALYTFKGGSMGLALVDAVITVGLLLGSVLVGRSGPGRPGFKFLTGLTLIGASFAAVGLTRNLVPALVLFAIGGAANMWYQVPMVTILQQRSEPELRGRVLAARTAVVRVASVIGLVGAGALAQRFGVEAMVGVIGLCIVLIALLGWTRPSLREA